MLHVACWKCRTEKMAKNSHLGTITQLYWAKSSQLRHVSTIGKKNLLNIDTSSTCPHNMVNFAFSLLTAEICWQVWGTPANFNGFRVLAALLHSTLVVGVSQTLRVEQRAPPIFGRATITLGIGPHSSYIIFSTFTAVNLALLFAQMAVAERMRSHLYHWNILLS